MVCKMSFPLTSLGSTFTEVENGNGALLINDIYQTPTTDNNLGNNYFYEYNELNGETTLVFTGITSSNGQRIESEFDVNQNQIPRGGLIVSVGSTPGLGYAPLAQASIEASVSGGVITGILTTDQTGITTDVKYARYDKNSGNLDITFLGAPLTAPVSITGGEYFNLSGRVVVRSSTPVTGILSSGDIVELDGLEYSCSGYSTTEVPVINAVYDEESGFVTVTTGSNHNAGVGQKVRLENLTFECSSGGAPSQQAFPSGANGIDFFVTGVISPTQFVTNVGVSTIEHTYISGGTSKVGFYNNFIPRREQGFRSRVNHQPNIIRC